MNLVHVWPLSELMHKSRPSGTNTLYCSKMYKPTWWKLFHRDAVVNFSSSRQKYNHEVELHNSIWAANKSQPELDKAMKSAANELLRASGDKV